MYLFWALLLGLSPSHWSSCIWQHLKKKKEKKKRKKYTTDPATYKQFYLKLIWDYPTFQKIFTDGSKSANGVATMSVILKNYHMSFTCHVPNGSAIFTAELWAVLLALQHNYHSQKKYFLILSDSLSSLQDMLNVNYDHPVLIKIHKLHSELVQGGKEIVSVWVPGHVGIISSVADVALRMPYFSLGPWPSRHYQLSGRCCTKDALFRSGSLAMQASAVQCQMLH